MAQSQVVSMPAAVEISSSLSLSNDELRRIEEYGKIINFRDRVLSGKHPTIKLPSHLLGAKSGNALNQSSAAASSPSAGAAQGAAHATHASATNTASAISNSTPSSSPPGRQVDRDTAAAANRQAFQANSTQPSVTTNFPGLGSLPVNGHSGVVSASSSITPGSAKPFGSARAEINPIFLEKSDHLIKTEIQMQRQRIERGLREQLEQRRNTSWALQPSEPLPDFDLMDVLQKALVLVEQTAPLSTDANVAANNKPDDSDSFDENTFYSSQFDDSPNSNHVARIADESESEDVEMRESPDYEPEFTATFAPAPIPDVETRPVVPEQQTAHTSQQKPDPPSHASHINQTSRTISENGQHVQNSQSDNSHKQGAGTAALADPPLQHQHESHEIHIVSSQGSRDASGSGESGNTDNDQSTDDLRAHSTTLARNADGFEAGSSTVVRAHNLSPLAPQPSHVSLLATARHPPEIVSERQPLRATPAQVVALRNELTAGSSPESSPQAGKSNDKRKAKKKNKRKADRQAADASPYIKDEPRSPSPMSAIPASRPHKRLRPTQRPTEPLNYDEPTYGGPAIGGYRDRPEAPAYREDAPRVIYERREVPGREGAGSIVLSTSQQQYEPDVYEIRRPPTTTQFVRSLDSSGLYPLQYGPSEARMRSVSHAVVERPSYREAPIYYRDVRDELRMSVRPGVDRERSRSPILREARAPTMAPPSRAQPTRIFIDEFGREYIEPPRPPTVIRQSIGTPNRPGENVIYEHAPPPVRAASRMPEVYGDGVIYRRASPAPYPGPRRVVTEPEYINGDYRSYRQREYPVPPPPGPRLADEYGRPLPERRPAEEAPREYIARAPSVRPAEPVRHQIPGNYGTRLSSVRPEPVREHAASVHPDARREVVQQPYTREYSVRPESHAIQRPYSVRPAEQHHYYERPVRGGDDVAFIERPRGGLEGPIYTDASRREAY